MRNKDVSEKEKAIYMAIAELMNEGADLNALTVSEITGRAGIGKGTAYEYFSDKDEMIAKALFYHVKGLCSLLFELLGGESTLYDKMNRVFLEMENRLAETNCILKAVHIMSENSGVGRRFKEMEEQEGKFLVEAIQKHILIEKNEEELPEETRIYLVMGVLSRILCYGMLLTHEYYMPEGSMEKLRDKICRSICREVEEA